MKTNLEDHLNRIYDLEAALRNANALIGQRADEMTANVKRARIHGMREAAKIVINDSIMNANSVIGDCLTEMASRILAAADKLEKEGR